MTKFKFKRVSLDKPFALICIFSLLVFFAPNKTAAQTTNRKGKLFASWGWNWSWYSHSDIQFIGSDHNFTIEDVKAHDRQSTSFKDYFKITQLSVPQYNLRVGYFIKDNYSISLAWDHMKYVMSNDQTVKIEGTIDAGTQWDGIYNGGNIVLTEDFIAYEHTDGLNFANVSIRRYEELYSQGKVSVELVGGLGAGVLVPRTDATILGKENYDYFHLAGYGFEAIIAPRVNLGKAFFFQSEFKPGFVKMTDVKTTPDPNDKAKQSFFVYQLNLIFGATVDFRKKENRN